MLSSFNLLTDTLKYMSTVVMYQRERSQVLQTLCSNIIHLVLRVKYPPQAPVYHICQLQMSEPRNLSSTSVQD